MSKVLKFIFRITHIGNVPHIMEYGLTTINSPYRNPDYIGIGDSQIDVYAKYWNSDSDLDLKRRKEAELLINMDIPSKYIRGYVVYNEEAKSILLKYGIADGMIQVAPNYYF